MPNKNNWSRTALAWMSIGYETQVPPISTLTFYNAIANDGKRALDLFHSEKPDLILLDIMLPELDGWQVCREIREVSNKPIINPIPNITIGDVFLLDMSNATEETINGVKSNAIKTYGCYQCVCDSITINKYNPKVVMDIRIASIDVPKIRLQYYVDTFDCNYTLCLYDKDNKQIGRYNRFSIRKANKTLLYIDKFTKGEFYEIGAISFDVLKAFVVSQYFDVVQYNGELYHTTCKWNGVKPTAFKSKFANICSIKLTKEDIEILNNKYDFVNVVNIYLKNKC